jgi:hypothetical protein
VRLPELKGALERWKQTARVESAAEVERMID